jgi:cAMP-dependent protein kinase regulator
VELLEIGRDLVWELIEDAPEVLQTLLRFFRDRLIDSLIATSPLFQPFSGGEAQELAKRFQFLELRPGTALATEGERTEGLFVLLCGEAEASAAGKPLASLGPGDLCGELSLLTRKPAIVTVRARSRLWALGLPRTAFQELIMIYPQILIYVNDVAEARRADVERRLSLV